mmetsp:Transcript_5977/g.12589  ORF Transcript_5977/g.12589 Transcript_5977/m.12589 type:complete len:97 (-) Transcript_5977:222-512(-)|eukprot:CAMPEP_0172446498 /NCGR_PEP_ID=MMETSP1065-20121228/6081_1 /TAXON_ID=265537 /ORGANISM="Amphiprora paludosa, Strain CCMP125" /LENGTH=96 /DNA_ID=CAMNT_0013197627 /DNA_START=104 /DNA_END=394 /DNA_ORIENTATION=+
MIGAVSRTRPLLKAASNELAMTKYWKKMSPRAEGEIRMHLSMNENVTVMTWIPTFPKKIMQRLHRWKWPVGVAATYYFLFQFADYETQKQDMEHRF